MINTIIATRAV